MKRLALRPYMLLGVCLFLALSFPQKGSHYLRSGFVSLSVPFFKFANWMLYSGALIGASIQPEQMQLESLQLENLALHAQIERIYTWLAQEEHLEGLTETERLTPERLGAIKSNLLEQSQFLPAKVVFREPAAWSSFIWIDIGQVENERIGFELIAANSPVISGSSLIGVVEYVGKNRSKVRLITDGALTPSVCGVRGKLQQRFLVEHIDPLLKALPLQKDLDPSDCETLIGLLDSIKQKSTQCPTQLTPSRGFVQGLSEPLWRAGNQTLKGMGYCQKNASTFQVGDVLVTSGMDGVFPQGLNIGVVSKVFPPNLADPTYIFEAQIAATHLDDLTHVQVIPPCR